ncbi:hypothetical protein P7K49_029947 [Saguinus oedipus]|uniref:Uncharacterized protein n=1 Tax=Saguinus oedipus TaxID=9490 RepID=A0ABQ9U8N3_SAGOE|nr:hypothetical protein P7K49_029947 [Saguinus oedipus]
MLEDEGHGTLGPASGSGTVLGARTDWLSRKMSMSPWPKPANIWTEVTRNDSHDYLTFMSTYAHILETWHVNVMGIQGTLDAQSCPKSS